MKKSRQKVTPLKKRESNKEKSINNHPHLEESWMKKPQRKVAPLKKRESNKEESKPDEPEATDCSDQSSD